MFKKILFLFIISLFLFSCSKKEEKIIPPSYENISITHTNMILNNGTGSNNLGSSDVLLSFDVQKNKFIIDKDLDFFSDKYTYILKSKDLTDKSYIGIKLFSVDSIIMNYKEDIERKLQSNNIKYSTVNDIGECLISSEGTELGEGYVYIKECNNKKYLVQLINKPYDNKEGKKEIGYKAFILDEKIKKFIIQEYFNFINNIESFDLSSITIKKNEFFKYTYLKNVINYNGYIELNKGKSLIRSYITNRQLVIKGDIGFIFDTFIDKQINFNLKFGLLKNIKTNFENFSFSKIPGKFIGQKLFGNYNIKINKFLLYEKNIDKNTIAYLGRFPNSIDIYIYEYKNSYFQNDLLTKFKNDFGYKKNFIGPTLKTKFIQYAYKGINNTYILMLGIDEKNNKEMKGKSIFIKVNNNFILNNIKNYSDFIGVIN